MLRSIDYAAAAAVQAIEQRLLTDPQRAERMSTTGADFVSAAFLEAYDLKIAGSPAEVQDRDARKKIVSLKFLIKALYEIRYEAEFRPAWIGLPVRGVLNLLDHMSNK
jgi:maltose alpha-D-glucosyltransferase/alpha-amylase